MDFTYPFIIFYLACEAFGVHSISLALRHYHPLSECQAFRDNIGFPTLPILLCRWSDSSAFILLCHWRRCIF
jgi:hypothetical protein